MPRRNYSPRQGRPRPVDLSRDWTQLLEQLRIERQRRTNR